MKLIVVFASLIAAVSLHSGALAQTASEPGRETRGSHNAAPDVPRPHLKPSIAAPERPGRKSSASCAPAPRAGTLGAEPFQRFLPRRQQDRCQHRAGPEAPTRTSSSASAGGPGASQIMQHKAASSYSTSSNALGFGLYRITPREIVQFRERHAPGTILVRQREKRLYYVNGDGTAIRYAIAVGREGAAWSGTSTVSDKREWPGWTPTPSILQAPTRSAAPCRRRPGQSARRACALSRPDHVSHPRHQRAVAHRRRSLVGLHPHEQRRHRRSL